MITFRAEETIARPAAEIFDFAADVERHPQWMGVVDARQVSGRPTEVGSRAREHMRLGPRRLDVEFEVAASDPGRRIAWRFVSGAPFVGEVGLELEPLGPDRTRAVYYGSLRFTGLWRLVEPLMAGEMTAGEAAELRRLKQVLEAGATTARTGT